MIVIAFGLGVIVGAAVMSFATIAKLSDLQSQYIDLIDRLEDVSNTHQVLTAAVRRAIHSKSVDPLVEWGEMYMNGKRQ